jgi:ABC-type uncharacterized transport system ATPase subunit
MPDLDHMATPCPHEDTVAARTRVVERMRSVEQQARRMLAAARVSDWRLFWELEMQCSADIAVLRRPESVAAARSGEQQAMLLRLLDIDAQIRELLTPLATGQGRGSVGHLH